MQKNTKRIVDMEAHEIEAIIERKIEEGLSRQTTKKPETDYNGYIEIDKASEVVHLSVSTIYSKTSKKEIPFLKRGKLLFKEADLIQWLEDGKPKSITDDEKELNDSLLGKKTRKRIA